jgi:Effector protein
MRMQARAADRKRTNDLSSPERSMAAPKPLDDSFLDKDGIKQRLLPLLKRDSAVDHFTEGDQIVDYKGSGRHPASNIVIALPGFFEWLEFFDRGPANAPIAAEVAAFRRAVADSADRVTKILNAIFFSTLSGFALFREIDRGQDQTLTVRPKYYKFHDADPGKQNGSEGDAAAVTHRGDWDDARNGTGADTTVYVGELLLSPKGIVSQLTSSLIAGEPADESLFHELVHAASMLNGTLKDRKTKMAGTHKHDRYKVDDESEFLAVQVTNLFRQEKGRKGLRFNHDSDEFKGPLVLDAYPHMVPSPRRIIREFRHLQHIFFDALANIPASKARSNIMREFRDE